MILGMLIFVPFFAHAESITCAIKKPSPNGIEIWQGKVVDNRITLETNSAALTESGGFKGKVSVKYIDVSNENFSLEISTQAAIIPILTPVPQNKYFSFIFYVILGDGTILSVTPEQLAYERPEAKEVRISKNGRTYYLACSWQKDQNFFESFIEIKSPLETEKAAAVVFLGH